MMKKDDRLKESQAKILPPFRLDPSLRFYSPQENVEALDHPVVRRFHRYVSREYEPLQRPGTAIALLLPCTKTKPYPFSLEHRRINRALLKAGFKPVPAGREELWPPEEMRRFLDPEELWAAVYVGPLRRGPVVVHRFVLSEPLGLVPYELVYRWRGRPSPASAYDDPGLFEHRGTSVSPWRADCTAIPSPNGRWRWGDAERAAYVEAHNRLSKLIAEQLMRLEPYYRRVVAWVAPGLTHRSFLLGHTERGREGLPFARRTGGGLLHLMGVHDHRPGLVDVHPTRAELDEARVRLARRLGVSPDDPRTRALFARGEGGGTPLALPELLDTLVKLISDPEGKPRRKREVKE
jgi:hypothetical protein